MTPKRGCALCWFLLASACSSPDSEMEGECGPNSPCPQGYSCEPLTSTCQLVSRGHVEPAADATPDAPVTDAPVDAPGADAEIPPDGAAAALLTITPPRGEFGSMTMGGTSAPISFKVANAGGQRSGTLVPVVSDAVDYALVGGTCVSGGLAPGASCDLLVQFKPTGQAGAKPATLTVTGTPGGTVTAPLSGTGLLPGEITLSPAEASFGEVAVGTTSAEQLFTVTNNGQSTTGPLVATLSDATSFHISSNGCAAGLAARATCAIGVRLAPAVVGDKRAELTVTASPGGTVVAALQGTPITTLVVSRSGNGVGKVTSADGAIDCGPSCTAEVADTTVILTATPEPLSALASWSVVGCGDAASCEVDLTRVQTVTATFVRTPALLELGPASAAFGAVTLGGASPPATFTVLNRGGSTSGTISATASDAQSYAVSLDGCAGKKLPSGASCTLSVRFQPAGAAGAKPATMTVAADPGGSLTATLGGTALTMAQLTLDRASAGYGSVATGSSAAATFTISNTGQSTSGTPSAVSSNPTEFAITSNGCGGALAPGASCQMTVRFAPAVAGSRSAQLSISASPGGSAAASLGGNGTAVVTVQKSGGLSGNAVITSSPAGISCGATCSATFSVPSLSLIATPASYSTFTGWSGGGCSGAMGCTLSLTASQTVTATFAPTPAAITISPTSADLGSVMTGNQSSVVSFTVTNTGGTATGVLYAYVGAEYAVVGGTCPYATLAGSGATCTVWVLLAPTSPGLKSSSVVVEDFVGAFTSATLGGSAYCGEYGQICTGSGNCCNSVPCTSGRCRYP